jgi:hypothetical protein
VTEVPGRQEAQAREEIRELAARHSFAVDTRDFDALTELFAPDVDNGRYGVGRDGTRRYFESLMANASDASVIHSIGNHQIDFVDDEHAYGVCYVRVVSGSGEEWSETAGCYVDDYVKRDGSWFIWQRRFCAGPRWKLDITDGIGKITLADAVAMHRERQTALRAR